MTIALIFAVVEIMRWLHLKLSFFPCFTSHSGPLCAWFDTHYVFVSCVFVTSHTGVIPHSLCLCLSSFEADETENSHIYPTLLVWGPIVLFNNHAPLSSYTPPYMFEFFCILFFSISFFVSLSFFLFVIFPFLSYSLSLELVFNLHNLSLLSFLVPF